MGEKLVTAEIKQALNLTAEKMIELINTNKLKGRYDSKSIWVDDSELPQDFKQPLTEKASEKPSEPTKLEPTLPQKSEAHLPSKPEILTRDILVTQTENFKAEAAKIEAEIKLAQVRGERDKPQILAQKETKLAELEKTLTQTQEALDKRKLELDGREVVIAGKETELKLAEQKINVRLAQIEIEIQKKYDEKDAEIIKRQQDLTEIEKRVDHETAVLNNMMNVISDYPKAIDPMVIELKKLIKVSKSYADYHYSIAQRSKGENEKNNFNLSNNFWNIKTTFEKILKNLTNT